MSVATVIMNTPIHKIFLRPTYSIYLPIRGAASKKPKGKIASKIPTYASLITGYLPATNVGKSDSGLKAKHMQENTLVNIANNIFFLALIYSGVSMTEAIVSVLGSSNCFSSSEG